VSEITWDLEALVDDFVAWLYDPADSNTSKVGTLCSPQFLRLISSSIEQCQRTTFQRMIYAESLAYTQSTACDKHYLSISELRQIGALAGHEVLKFLDNKLKPQSLKDASYNDIQSYFLIVFGTILLLPIPYPPRKLLNPHNR